MQMDEASVSTINKLLDEHGDNSKACSQPQQPEPSTAGDQVTAAAVVGNT